MTYIFSCTELFNFIFIILFKNLNIYDYPSENKIHFEKLPLLGGSIFLVNIIFIYF